MRIFQKAICLVLSGFLLIPLTAFAQQLDSTHKQWKVFSAQQSTGTLCYIASSPTSQTGSAKSRGQVYLWVAARTHSIDEVSASSGFTYKAKGDVTLTVDSKPFTFFAQGDTAWAKDEATDKAIIAAMKRGSTISVQGTSENGTSAKDSYSLSGFSAAYNRMKALCPK